MNIEGEVFERYIPDSKKLVDFGFEYSNKVFVKEFKFFDNKFCAKIKINESGSVEGKIYDLESDDEYLPLRVESQTGGFACEVRQRYVELLIDIRDKCFNKKSFIYEQTNRIVDMVKDTYGDEPEFLWERYPGCGVIRNPKTKKWYLAILDVDRSKLEKNKEGLVEILNLKLDPNEVIEITKQKGFYPAWHMNKKSWISIILDNRIEDSIILNLIEKSHFFSEKRK